MGQPLYMACVSNSTLKTLEMVGVNVTAAQAEAARHASEQAYMGEGRDVQVRWQCSANSTMVSSLAQVLSDSIRRFHGKALFYTCPNPDSCIVQDGLADCAEGYWGPLCALCLEGFVWSEGHVCMPCEGDTRPWRAGAAVGAVVSFVIGMYVFVAHPLFE